MLSKLRHLLDHAQGTPDETVALRAADLLGKSIGLYRDVRVEEKPQRTPEEIRAELEERLKALAGEKIH